MYMRLLHILFKRRVILVFFIMINFSGISGQNKVINRKPYVAGQFYPARETELSTTLRSLFDQAEVSLSHQPIRALLVPHAGYEFSGTIAAHGYKQLLDLKAYDNVFILASSHRVSLGKASVYSSGDYITPMGTVEVNKDIAKQLLQNQYFCFEPKAHNEEHSIEVQIPFLQYLGEVPPIIPIVIASQTPSVLLEIAAVLKPWFNQKNLFIISADLSHFPRYEDAQIVDKKTIDAFCLGNPDTFLKSLDENEKSGIRGLATAMCAWPAAYTFLNLSQNQELIYEPLAYSNSGDHRLYGDKRRVVGYQSVVIRDQNIPDGFYLSSKDKFDLLNLARETLNSFTTGQTEGSTDRSIYSPVLSEVAGAFVSLKIDGQLRGCIGQFDPKAPIYKLIPELAISSAARDTRFMPVRNSELKDINIEISILTPMKKIKDISEIELGTHGIYIKKGSNSGTFLPQVAKETGWDLIEFLGRCSQDKARIGYDGWKTADIFTYEAIVFKEL